MCKYYRIIIVGMALLCLTLSHLHATEYRGIDYNWFWMVYDEEKKDAGRDYKACRPFYLHNDNPYEDFTASLMPFVYWSYTSPRQHEWKSLFGFMGAVDYTHSNGARDYDFGLFPILLYGKSDLKKDRYFHLWPFGGTIKGKLATDEINTAVFPGVALFFLYPPSGYFMFAAYLVVSLIPVHTTYTMEDYRAWGILWPLIQRGKSPIRDDFRFLPFYAHNYKQGFYDTYQYALLFNYRKEYIGNEVQKTFFALPFFGRRWTSSDYAESSSLFWPLFSWGYNRKSGEFSLNFPWPLVQVQDSVSPRIKKRIFFPFYGDYQKGSNSTYFITPLHFVLKKSTPALHSEYHINGIIAWYFTREYMTRTHHRYGNSWRFFKLWPLFHYEYNDLGDYSFNMLSLLPFRDPEGYERLYQPFWTLFEYHELRNGEKRLGLLLRTYYQRWGDDFFSMKIPFLIGYTSRNDRIEQLSLLFSFFSYTNNEDKKCLKIAWIPFIKEEKEGDKNSSGKNNEQADNRGYNQGNDTGLYGHSYDTAPGMGVNSVTPHVSLYTYQVRIFQR
ncbi:MAG TPA: hypothetical protein VKQ10_04375 [Spirochaetota bacterium]|nr:hypothetical protein [Spirochaetota bacterium]